ncbi:MAG: ribosome biogenesis GTPase Der [Candidatus Gracilibacteria bacterium]|nr:ribosome biogenesis GTPase Der [Candidatus Gracilibacteria bacterium]
MKKVALVGRPNVGKSTLFNRLLGKEYAIISDTAGTTRDRLYHACEWDGYAFQLVDMGGLDDLTYTEDSSKREIEEGIQFQAEAAIIEADLILFLVDARSEILEGDIKIAKMLRKQEKPVLLVSNKCEAEKHQQSLAEFQKLGLGPAIPVSAKNGNNTDLLLEKVIKKLKLSKQKNSDYDIDELQLAIVGKPNVGKSSILNAITGTKISLVSKVAGTTRDTIDTKLEYKGQRFNLIDTAGIRRKGKIGIRNIEHYSVLRSLKAIERCQIAVLIIDATEGITKQDQHVIEYVLEAKKGLILVVNKWDLIEKDEHTMPQFEHYLQKKLDYVPWAPLVFTSAVTGQRLTKILDLARTVREERLKRIETSKLNSVLEMVKIKHPPAARNKKHKKPKFYYATQADVDPPTFVFFVNDIQCIHFSYLRYIENSLREEFGFLGTPLIIRLKDKKE